MGSVLNQRLIQKYRKFLNLVLPDSICLKISEPIKNPLNTKNRSTPTVPKNLVIVRKGEELFGKIKIVE